MGQSVGPEKRAEEIVEKAKAALDHPDATTAKVLEDLQQSMGKVVAEVPDNQQVLDKLTQINKLHKRLVEDTKKLDDLRKENAKELTELTKLRDNAKAANAANVDDPNHAWITAAGVGAKDMLTSHEAVMIQIANQARLPDQLPVNFRELLEEHQAAIEKIRALAPGNTALRLDPAAVDTGEGGGDLIQIQKKNNEVLQGDGAGATDEEKKGLLKVVEEFNKLKNSTSAPDVLKVQPLRQFIEKQRDTTIPDRLDSIRKLAIENATYPDKDKKINNHLLAIKAIREQLRLALGPLNTAPTSPTAKPGEVVNETAKKAFTKLVAAVTEKKNITDATVTGPLGEINVEFKKLVDKPKQEAFFQELKKELVPTAFEPALNKPDEITLVVRAPALPPGEEAKLTGLAKTIFDFLETTEKTFGVDLSPFKQLLKTPGGAIALDEKNEVNLSTTLDNLHKERDRTDDAIRILKRNPRVDRAKLRELQDRLQRIDDAIEAIKADDKLSPDERVKARQILRQLRDINREAEDLGFNVQFHYQAGLSPFASVHSPVRPFSVNPYAYGPRYGAYQRPPYAASYSQPGSTYVASDYSYGKTSGSNRGPA